MVIIRYDTSRMRSWTVPAQCSADHSSGNPDRTKQAQRSAHAGSYSVSSEVRSGTGVSRAFLHGPS